jgi:hypothetical protein
VTNPDIVPHTDVLDGIIVTLERELSWQTARTRDLEQERDAYRELLTLTLERLHASHGEIEALRQRVRDLREINNAIVREAA